MRRSLPGAAVPALAVLGAALLAVGVCWGYGVRHDAFSVAVTVTLAMGTALGAGSLLAAREWPHWPGPLALVGLCDLGGGAYASAPLAALGVLLLAIALLGWGRQLERDGRDHGVRVAAQRLRALADASGSRAAAQVTAEHLGRGLVRLVVVGEDGAWGDVLVRGEERARRAIEVGGLAAVEPSDRALGARLRTGTYEWRRMAGQQLRGGRP